MDKINWTNLAIAGGILYGAYKFGTPMVRGAAASIAAVVIAKNVPYVKDYI